MPLWQGAGWACGMCEFFNAERRSRCRNCGAPSQDGILQREATVDEDEVLGFERGTVALLRKLEEAVRDSCLGVRQRALAAALWRTVTGHPMLAACVDFEPVTVTIESGGRLVRVDVRFFSVPGTDVSSEGRGVDSGGKALSILGILEGVLEGHEGGTSIDGNTLRGIRGIVENLREALGARK